jgi:hypothetical protein
MKKTDEIISPLYDFAFSQIFGNQRNIGNWTLPLLVYRKISTKYNDKERENDKENHQKTFLHGGIQEGSGGIGGKTGEANQPGS